MNGSRELHRRNRGTHIECPPRRTPSVAHPKRQEDNRPQVLGFTPNRPAPATDTTLGQFAEQTFHQIAIYRP